MPRQNNNKVYRVIDANVNRLKEGIRVCEDVVRFMIEDYILWSGFKNIRHRIFEAVKKISSRYKLIETRDIIKDIGKKTTVFELKRKDHKEIFFANIQRAKESLRVLEEFSKILRKDLAREFKKIRYQIYELERKVNKRLK